MDNVFPLILETLSNKPLSEETEKTLIKDVRLKIKNQNLKTSNFKKDFDKALETGQDLGIFQLVGENVRLPFSLQNKKTQPESKSSRSKSAITDKERKSSRRGRSSRRRSQSRSRTRSGARSRSQRRRRVSRR